MPKKTRREKIIADARNTLQAAHGSPYQFTALSVSKEHTIARSEEVEELIQIKRDLAKTILLAATAFAVEFGLWRFWNS